MIIAKSLLFEGMPAEFVSSVGAMLHEEHHDEGKTLFRAGDAAETLYFLEDGRVRLTVGDPGSVCRTVRTPGEVFGWSSLLGSGGYTATAQCLTSCRVMKVNAADLSRVLEQNPAIGMEFYRRVAAMVRERLIDSYRHLVTYDSRKPQPAWG